MRELPLTAPVNQNTPICMFKVHGIRKGSSIHYRHQFFGTSENITEKPMEVYYLDEWIIICSLHVAGFLHPAILLYFHHSSDKSAMKVTDCTVQSAIEYWCSYGT